MPATIAPADEACQAIVTRLNSNVAPFAPLPVAADYAFVEPDLLEATEDLIVTAIHVDERDIDQVLDAEDRTQHTVFVYLRKSVPDFEPTTTATLKLTETKIKEWLSHYVSADHRVRVTRANLSPIESPDKATLQQAGLFVGLIALEVEVAPHA